MSDRPQNDQHYPTCAVWSDGPCDCAMTDRPHDFPAAYAGWRPTKQTADSPDIDRLTDRIKRGLASFPDKPQFLDGVDALAEFVAHARDLERRLKLEYTVRMDTRRMLEAAEADRDRLRRERDVLDKECERLSDECDRLAVALREAAALSAADREPA